jgi:hypothetical protein
MGIVRDAITHFAVLMVSVAGLLPSSGETTSAIVGQLRDITNAVPGATWRSPILGLG